MSVGGEGECGFGGRGGGVARLVKQTVNSYELFILCLVLCRLCRLLLTTRLYLVHVPWPV